MPPLSPENDPEFEAASHYPGARRPDRNRTLDVAGLQLAVYEWGDTEAPPLLLAHGGFDFAGTYDEFAPLLADAGFRVISWDQRGHGDSEHAELYTWDADVRDALAVLDSVTSTPVPFVGHSKGAGLLIQLAQALPHRVERIVTLDGLPSRRPHPDVADHERTRLLDEELTSWLDRRREADTMERKPGTIDGLARRRQHMNPRLSIEWLRYLVTVGARLDPDGWRWKIDPVLRFGGFGPWRPEWALERLAGLGAPLLGILATADEPMGWGTTEETVKPYLPDNARLISLDETGHFVHIERPREVAAWVLEFLS